MMGSGSESLVESRDCGFEVREDQGMRGLGTIQDVEESKQYLFKASQLPK